MGSSISKNKNKDYPCLDHSKNNRNNRCGCFSTYGKLKQEELWGISWKTF